MDTIRPTLASSLPKNQTTIVHDDGLLQPTAIAAKYASLATVATPAGATVQSYLGAALGTPTPLAAGGLQQLYVRGVIVARKTGGTFVIYGDIYAQWYRLGGPTGLLGLPLTDQVAVGSGYLQTFDGGDIGWSAATGARSIHGAIRDRWLALGGATGVLGFPTSDESPLLANGTEIGRYNTFVNGAGIYWSGATGAWDVYGAIAACWKSYGGPTGALGLPISGETNTPDAGGRYNEFSGGIVVWHPSGPYNGAYALLNLDVYLDHFESDFSPIHVQVNVDAHGPDLSNHTWFPSASDYASNPSVQHTLLSVPTVKAATTVDVWMDGLGQHTFGQDERLGIFSMHYDITNLWGILENATHPVNTNIDADHHLNCIFSCRTQLPLDPNLPFRAQYFWPFSNFGTDVLSDTTFAQTFGDVHEDESALWHPFDQLFYNVVYKTMASGGNCFGMCLEALYAIAGRSVINEPIYNNPVAQYGTLAQGAKPDPDTAPNDARFTGPINIKHGYQVGDRIVFYFLSEFVAGHTHDPVGAFERSLAAFNAGDRPIISLQQGSGFGAGHAVLPYAWNNSTSPWTISVANPNAPYSLVSDNAAPPCRIDVDPASNTFSFVMGYNKDGTPNTWSGSGSGGGRMFHIPFSEMNAEPNTPIDDILALIASSAFIILSGDGQTTQITDQHGRTLNGTTPQTRIPAMSAIPLVSDAPLPIETSSHETATLNVPTAAQPVRLASLGLPETYALTRPPTFARVETASVVGMPIAESATGSRSVSLELDSSGDDVNLTWEIASTGTGSYVWALRSGAGSVVATVPANATGADIITVANVARSLPAVSLQGPAGCAKTAAVTFVGPAVGGSAATRIFEVSGIPVSGTAGITMQLQNEGDALQIENAAGDVTLGVRMQVGSSSANAVTRNVVATGANTAITVEPVSWSAPSFASTAVLVKNYDRPGGAVLKQMQM